MVQCSKVKQQRSRLSFYPFRLSDAGQYSCEITVTAASENFTAIQNQSIILHSKLLSYHASLMLIMGIMYLPSAVPAPTSVSTTSNSASPIWPVGADITLTCTVDLDPAVDDPAVDDPVTVNTVWTGPDGVTLSSTDPVMINMMRYTSTVMVSSFGRNQSGNYSCIATVTSISPFFVISNSHSGTTNINIGKSNRRLVHRQNRSHVITKLT